jgi:hypothetical protein
MKFSLMKQRPFIGIIGISHSILKVHNEIVSL